MMGRERLRGKKRRRSNGQVEGHNVVVKLLKEVSFGMRDPDLYAKKIMLGAYLMRFSPQVLTWNLQVLTKYLFLLS